MFVFWSYILKFWSPHTLIVFFCGFLKIFYIQDHAIYKWRSSYFFLSNLDAFYFIFFPNSLTRISSTMLKGKGKSGILVLSFLTSFRLWHYFKFLLPSIISFLEIQEMNFPRVLSVANFSIWLEMNGFSFQSKCSSLMCYLAFHA